MLKLLICLIAGALFGVGLALAGMTNPVKVQNFLTWREPGTPVWPLSWGAL